MKWSERDCEIDRKVLGFSARDGGEDASITDVAKGTDADGGG